MNANIKVEKAKGREYHSNSQQIRPTLHGSSRAIIRLRTGKYCLKYYHLVQNLVLVPRHDDSSVELAVETSAIVTADPQSNSIEDHHGSDTLWRAGASKRTSALNCKDQVVRYANSILADERKIINYEKIFCRGEGRR